MEGVVLFDYSTEQDDELSLNVGDIVTDVTVIEEGWCEGTLNGIRGVFPDNFVKLKPKVEAVDTSNLRTELAGNTCKRRAKVAYSYTAENPDELNLPLGSTVEVLGEEEEGWWRGKLDGREGVFPSNFVQLIEEAEEKDSSPVFSSITPKPAEKARPPSMIAMPGLGGINPNKLRQKLTPVSPAIGPSLSEVTAPASILKPALGPPAPTVKKSQPQKAKVMFSYHADQDDEVSVTKGDTVDIISTETDQDGWWKIRAGGKVGLVPDNFLSAIASSDYKPVKRRLHSTVRVGDYLYMWGGDQPDLPKVHNNDKKKALSSLMEVYHLPTSRWEQKPTTGNPPLGILGYVSAAIGNEIFYFGGGCNHDSCYHNSLYSFNVDTFTWRELSPTTPHHGPMIKAHCSMVAFQLNGKDYLAVIGGQGPSSNNTPTQPNAQYNSKGMAPGLKRTNEIHYYKLSSGKWSSPNVTGDRPPPTSYFTLTSITNDCAILFGGATPNGSSNNTYIVNFSHTSVNFSNLGVSVQKPKKQYAHSSVFINSKLGPHLLVVGGYSKDDCWLLDVNKRRWKQLSNLPTRVTDRRCHSMSVWSITPTIDWIIVFGGGSRYKDTAVIELRYIDNNWSVSEIPLTPLDQYQEKLRERRREWEASQPVQPHHHQNKERETKLPTQQLQEKGRELQKDRREIDRLTRLLQERERELKEERIEKEQVRTRLQEQLESRERESQEREQQLQREIERAQEEKNQILRQQERESEEREQQLQTQLQQEVQGREREVQQALNLQQQLQQEVQEGREREQNLQQQLQETERQLQQQLRERDEHELRERESSWIVSRNDIIMTGRVLGRGGWAEVRVASFHGLEVAAKVLHDTIISEYNLSLFSRDINIASKIRHPNLLQFIGATTEGNPIILTELMPTSLRKELETGGLAYHAVLDISLDVAFALNYLHLFKPHPILHRDVSSANVLLQSIGHGWRAKLSDYGQPFIDRTTNPGNPVYSAPEAANPREHSPAMDVFSYGVLLVEMVSRRIPLPDERRALIDGIRRASFRSLVQCCLIVEYRQRPTMNDIITELKETIY